MPGTKRGLCREKARIFRKRQGVPSHRPLPGTTWQGRNRIRRSAVYPLKAMASPISVTLAPRDPPAAVVALAGEHDTYSLPRLENEFTVLLEESRSVVIDLRDTEFIDSTCLSALLGARHRDEEAGLGFTLVLPNRTYTQVHQLLDLTGLDSAFAIFPTLDEGLTAARAGQSGSS